MRYVSLKIYHIKFFARKLKFNKYNDLKIFFKIFIYLNSYFLYKINFL